MLYELVAIVSLTLLLSLSTNPITESDSKQARPGNVAEVKDITLTIGNLILRKGGVIRGLANFGVYSLPKPLTRHQTKHRTGHYFVIRYDAPSAAHDEVRATLRVDPRMVRSAHVKLGDGKLESIAKYGAPAWS